MGRGKQEAGGLIPRDVVANGDGRAWLEGTVRWGRARGPGHHLLIVR